jgi:hypothetical protein
MLHFVWLMLGWADHFMGHVSFKIGSDKERVLLCWISVSDEELAYVLSGVSQV